MKIPNITDTSKHHRTEALTWRNKDINKTAHLDLHEKWLKDLSTQPESNVLAKGLNFAAAPKQTLVVDLIRATVSHQKQQAGRPRGRTATFECISRTC